MIGKEILNYTVISFIGKGGMGSVYLGEHKYIKNQKVAIKVINKEMVNSFTKKRLEEEAIYLAGLNHQNIVHFQDYHIDDEGNLYLIIEYADGMTLDKYIQNVSGLIVEDRICALFEPILDAVGYAHKHKVVHLDIKPANIIITNEGIPKVLDFGIAKIMNEDENAGQDDELIMGTPSYMSPEQVKGEKLDGRSDIYSLGVLLHQMMTGNAPYDITTMKEHEINKMVVEEPLPRMQTYYKYISDRVQAVVDKATAKRREERFQSCEEFKRALHKAIYPPKIPIWTKMVAAAVFTFIIVSGLYVWDYNRTKIYYYKDYVEQWGIPQGVHELSNSEQRNRLFSYRMVYSKHRLQRLSLVNSRGNLVKHNNSDVVDRPTDMLLYYQSNGKVDYVKVMDQSGKVLYVKDYNVDLNVATYKYDDEYGTEKNLSANTTAAFNSSFVDDNSSRSKISRHLISYDKNGFVTKVEYAAFQNIKVGDNEGIFGVSYKHDSKGRVIEQTFLGYDGMPKGVKTGMAIKTFEYDDKDDKIKSTYLTASRLPSGEEDLGVPVCRNKFDEYGNEVEQRCEDLDGNLVLRKDANIAGFFFEINDGFLVKQYYIGLDGERGYDNEGHISGQALEYDENGYLAKSLFLDVDGTPMSNSYGYYGTIVKNDNNGNNIWIAYLNEDGSYFEAPEGFSIVEFKYDSVGNMIERSWHNADGTLTDDDIAVEKCEYDNLNRLVYNATYDKDGQPVKDYSGVYVSRSTYSVQGNLVQKVFYDASGEHLMENTEGIAGWTSEFDDFGNEIKRQFFDKNQIRTIIDGDKFAGWEAAYDDMGNRLDIHYFDKNGTICMTSNRYAGVSREYDERGNILSEKYYDTNKRMATGTTVTKYKYNSLDHIVEMSFLNEKGEPTNGEQGYHKVVYEYDDFGNNTAYSYYNTVGRLTIVKGDKYAVVRNKYDERGNITETAYYGTKDERVSRQSDRVSIQRSEYDNLGRVIRQTYYDEKEEPTKPSVMVPEGLASYDKWGNINYIASGDGHGNLIYNPAIGCCVMRYEYNKYGDLLQRTCYDEKDTPMNNKLYGYHKVVYEYDDKHKETSVSYYDKSGTLINDKVRRMSQPQDTQVQNSVSIASDTNWQDDIKNLANELPIDLGDNVNHLVFQSARITGNNSCELIFKIPKSKYEMSEDDVNEYLGYVKMILSSIKENKKYSSVYFSVILKDSKERELKKF